MPGQGVTSMFNFGFGVGLLHGIIAAKGLELYKVHPIRWKNRILKNPTRDKTVAIDYCLEKFPGVNLQPSGKKPHDGIADALCMSEYARHFHSESTERKPRGAQASKRVARKAPRS
jgi:crossover junction endodeoxyribonuclease RuvC